MRSAVCLSLSLLLSAPLMIALPAWAQQASIAATDGTNALGSIPCSPLNSVALGNCPAELLRKEDGSATLRVLMPGGRTRSLYIEGGEVTASDSPDPVRGGLRGSTYYVFVGDEERFEIPGVAMK